MAPASCEGPISITALRQALQVGKVGMLPDQSVNMMSVNCNGGQPNEELQQLLKKRKGKWLPVSVLAILILIGFEWLFCLTFFTSNVTPKEEEQYASFLIEGFASGLTPNVSKGTSLRTYLSRKLYCSPMRISKKYAGTLALQLSCSWINVLVFSHEYMLASIFIGQQVGAQVFLPNLGIPDHELIQRQNYYTERGAQMEKKFIESVLRVYNEVICSLFPFLCRPLS